jgi:hypothetical protein
MCNSILISPWTVSAVGPVGPVVLHRIWCEQVVPSRGTGGTGMRRAMLPARIGNLSWWSHRSHPSVPPKVCRTACSTTGTTGPTR